MARRISKEVVSKSSGNIFIYETTLYVFFHNLSVHRFKMLNNKLYVSRRTLKKVMLGSFIYKSKMNCTVMNFFKSCQKFVIFSVDTS